MLALLYLSLGLILMIIIIAIILHIIHVFHELQLLQVLHCCGQSNAMCVYRLQNKDYTILVWLCIRTLLVASKSYIHFGLHYCQHCVI